METRLKVGEAIVKVARRCGDALPKYAHLILPGIMQVRWRYFCGRTPSREWANGHWAWRTQTPPFIFLRAGS